ncbi:acyl-CoA N-acyltransferase [Fimicolochytrium jonesii]|uniref:acyl-CoA N-acyltransferase n=1 Tax=Fimicolochytrium jonesii TaxID=1396493 RepID=UPI0022FDC62C|nr:acyl-CoA N-acyltransferase [Fimicolochytrium jonesii]KAI8824540.1 acyl-CoA N-acyltransferase [Fimicolochytrium jonesii]
MPTIPMSPTHANLQIHPLTRQHHPQIPLLAHTVQHHLTHTRHSLQHLRAEFLRGDFTEANAPHGRRVWVLLDSSGSHEGDDGDGQVAGMVCIDPLAPSLRSTWGVPKTEEAWMLHSLMIQPELQGGGRGIGGWFLGSVLERVKSDDDVSARPRTRLFLDCWAGNASLRAFYERAGWTLWGIFREREGAEEWDVSVYAYVTNKITITSSPD